MKNKVRSVDNVVSIGTRRAAVVGARLGRVVAITGEGALLVEYAGNPVGPLPAVLALPLRRAALTAAAAEQRDIVLVFDNGDPLKPVIVGLVSPTAVAVPPGDAIDVQVDGKSVTFSARDEIVLRCGQASLILRKDGKVVLRGATVESHATGTNRIKGATVKVN